MPDDSAFSAARVALHPENIPASLKALRQWCVWRYQPRATGKPAKLPCQPDGKPAKSNDPATWHSFTDCLAAYQRGGYAGVGIFVAGKLTGLDLDHCIAGNVASEAALEILGKFSGTYCEVSPSGTGYRILCLGKPPRSGKNLGKVKWLEVYAEPSSRFLSITGNVVCGAEVTEQQMSLNWLHQRYFAGASQPDGEPATTSQPDTTPVFTVLGDAELIEKATRDATVAALWAGDTSAYGNDASSADMALCGALAWWTNSDAAAMDRLFRQSKLYRDKWDSKRGDTTYGAQTVALAISNCRGGYSGQRPDNEATSGHTGATSGTNEAGKGGHSGGGTAGAGTPPPDGGDTTSEPPPDGGAADDAEIARLAKLPLIEYDRQRKAAAMRLGIRPETLDKAVKAARGDADKAGNGGGATLEFAEVEPWTEAVDGATLLNELVDSVKRFLAMPNHAAAAVALWTVNSWVVVTHGHIAPILAVTSPEKRCGKSTLLDWLYRLVDKPLLAANITAAAVFRTVDACSPTLVIDEADSFLGEGSDELRGILNSGHARHTAFVIRCTGDDSEPRRFKTWGCKAIALIGKLEGRFGTLADRSIEIQLRRKLPSEKLMKLRHADAGHFVDMARRCARFALDNGARIGKARPDIPDTLHDRAADNWESLLAIADIAGGNWPRLARTVAEKLSGGAGAGAGAAGDSIGVQLLADLKRYFDSGNAATYPTEMLLGYLTSIDDAPWPTYAKGKPMTARNLARLLRPYGILPQTIRFPSGLAKGYTVADFADAFSRYLPSNRNNDTSQSNSGFAADSASATDSNCYEHNDATSASQQAGCDGVTGKTEGTGPAGGEYRFEV